MSEENQHPFPAARVGIIAGISAALTLLAVAFVFFMVRLAWGVHVDDEVIAKNGAALRERQVISENFRSKLAAYGNAAIATHDAAATGWKQYVHSRDLLKSAGTALDAAVKSERESQIDFDLQSDEIVYDDCVIGAIGPDYRTTKLTECEGQTPKQKILDAFKEAGIK